jgi:hypothetical protein
MPPKITIRTLSFLSNPSPTAATRSLHFRRPSKSSWKRKRRAGKKDEFILKK